MLVESKIDKSCHFKELYCEFNEVGAILFSSSRAITHIISRELLPGKEQV